MSGNPSPFKSAMIIAKGELKRGIVTAGLMSLPGQFPAKAKRLMACATRLALIRTGGRGKLSKAMDCSFTVDSPTKEPKREIARKAVETRSHKRRAMDS